MHPLPSPSWPRLAAPRPAAAGLTLALVVAVGLAGCATSRSTRERFLERVPPPQPLLNATATFGGGILTAQAWLGPSVRLRKPGERGEEIDERGGGRRGRFGGGEREEDPFSRYTAPFEEDRGDENQYTPQEIDEMYGKVNYQYVLPPRLALTLTFANTGRAKMMVAIEDINSPLGDFAPRPEQLILGPGQEGALYPMLSNLETNYDALDVTVSVRIGDHRETQVLQLRKSAETHVAPSAH